MVSGREEWIRILYITDYSELFSCDERSDDLCVKNNNIYSDESSDIIYGNDLSQTYKNGVGTKIILLRRYEDNLDIDFVELDDKKNTYKCWKRLKRLGLLNKTVMVLNESGAVDWKCRPIYYRLFRRTFPVFLTYRDDCVNEVDILKTYVVMSRINNIEYSPVTFDERKLLCMICAKKRSHLPHEMYFEREKNVKYFEKHPEVEFDLYGPWWGNKYKNWRGTIRNKREAYHTHRFTLCIENSYEPGYVTEKIFDAFRFGVVPVYAGPPNVDEYIPKDCYIDYYSFKSTAALIAFLSSMSEDEYNKYLEAVKSYLDSSEIEKMYDGIPTCKKCIEEINNSTKKLSEVQMFCVDIVDRVLYGMRRIITWAIKAFSCRFFA